MSIIMGALGGMGEAMGNVGSTLLKNDLDTQRDASRLTLESNLATQRAKTLEDYKLELTNLQRGQMVQRVDTAANQIADEKLAPKIAQEQAGIVDPSSWTPEQQAAVDQSNSMDRQGIVSQAKLDGSAGLASGDISPEKAMENTSRQQITQMRMDSLLDRANDRNATLKEIADVRSDAMRYGYELRLQAAEEKRLTGKIDTATGRMLITSEDANIKASTNQMQMLNRELQEYTNGGRPVTVPGPDGKPQPHPRIAEIQQQIQGLRDDIKTSQTNKTEYLRAMNIPGTGGPSGTPGQTLNGAPYPEGTVLNGPGGKYIVKNGVPVPVK